MAYINLLKNNKKTTPLLSGFILSTLCARKSFPRYRGIKTTVKQENSAEINIDNAIVDEVVEASTTNRITLKEYFRRFNIRYGTFVTESSLDLNYKVLSKYFTYVDEVTDEWKKRAMIETYINGEYGKRQLFE